MAKPDEQSRTDQFAGVPTAVVGIGASAGGLQPLQQIFDHLSSNLGAAFVVVQHLSPDFESVMDELLARHTRMPVRRAEHRMPLEPNTVYVIPPKKNLVLSETGLMLAEQKPERGHPPTPIDIFLESLAANFGDSAAAVILSGSGSDGTRGIRAINEHGGVIFVQNPETAQFDGMPRSAILTGLADHVLPPDALSAAVSEFVQRQPRGAASAIDSSRDAHWIERITAIVSADYSLDFSHYKPSTLRRRIARRCRVCGQSSLENYFGLLEGSEKERSALRQDLLIRVTGFFRDPEAWHRIETKVLPRLVKQAQEQGGFRAWVAGCCTGEEAYSLGLLVLEVLEREGLDIDVKIFATDIDQGSLDHASAGVFPVIGDELSEERKQRFFKRRGDGYVAIPELRRTLIFARHNLAQDAPFTRMHLVSCRNLLIYMQTELQKRVLASLHYALNRQGVLFLGSAESPGALESDLAEIDRKARLFEKIHETSHFKDSRRKTSVDSLVDPLGPARVASAAPGRRSDSLAEEAFADLLRARGSACLIVTRAHTLIQAFGDTQRFLSVPEGREITDVTKMVSRELALPVRALVHRVARDAGTAAYRSIQVGEGKARRNIDLRASCRAKTPPALITLLLEERGDQPEETPAVRFDGETMAVQRITELENELQQTRENLQATIEELQTTNEEHQATNEELLAANEELQSTNEELHSVNEELHTVNAEYQSKIEELTQLNNDIDNLLSSTEIATLFLDRDLQVRKFTSTATQIFNLLEQDIGRPIEHITNQMSPRSSNWIQSLRSVLETGEPVQRDVETIEGRALLARITPYRDHRGRTEGVVLTFVDISEKQRAMVEFALLRRLVDAIGAAADFTSALEIALRDVCETCGWSYGEAWVLNEDASRLMPSSVWHRDDARIAEFRRASEGLRFGPGEGMPGRAWASATAEWIPDVRVAGKLFHRSEAAEAAGLGAALCVPVSDEGRVVAALAFFMGAERAEEKRLVDLASTVAGQLGAALQRKRNEEALQRTTTLLQQITENVEDVFYVRDQASGAFLYVSPAYERLWGRETDTLLESPEQWRDSVYRRDRHVLDRVLKRPHNLDLRYRIVRPDGSMRWIWDRVFAVREFVGGPRRIVGIARDITPQREIRELVRSNTDLEQFAYAASHDLKAPLRGISNLAIWIGEEIAEGRLDEAQAKLAQLRERSDRMRSMVDGLLEFSRAGHIAENVEEVDVRELIEVVGRELSFDRGYEIKCKGRFPMLRTVRAPLSQVFENLIANAVKHHDQPTCEIVVSCQKQKDRYEFRIADDGPGIAEENHERVFKLFQKLDSHEAKEGAGLGLALVKRIVEEVGGNVMLEQNKPRGLVVRFSWPRDFEQQVWS